MKQQLLIAVILLASTVTGATEQSVEDKNVTRAVFTHNVVDREPVDQIGQLGSDADKVYFYTELRGLAGHTVTHRWQHGSNTMAEVKFDVGGDRWRVWSSKKLKPDWFGKWTVIVFDDTGSVLAQESMAYVPLAETGTLEIEPPQIIDTATEYSRSSAEESEQQP